MCVCVCVCVRSIDTLTPSLLYGKIIGLESSICPSFDKGENYSTLIWERREINSQKN